MTKDGGDMTEEEACHRVERTQSHVRGTVSDLKCVLSAACFAEQMREDSAHSLPRSSGAGVSCRGT